MFKSRQYCYVIGNEMTDPERERDEERGSKLWRRMIIKRYFKKQNRERREERNERVSRGVNRKNGKK